MKRQTLILGLLLGAGICTLAFKENINADGTFKAIDLSNFNTTVRAQDDFYEYVNGNWIKNNPIPATETSWGNFNVLHEKSQKALRAICEEAANNKTSAAGSNDQKIGDFFASGMDSISIENEKFTPIQPLIDKINQMKTSADITTTLAELHKIQTSAGFGFYVMADMKDSKVNMPYLFQSGTGLPEKDYYFNDELKMFREGYQKHLGNMFKLMGDNEANSNLNATKVFSFEKQLADSSMSAVEMRDQEKQYNKMSMADLKKLCPNFDWAVYFKTLGAPDMANIIVSQPAFMRQFNSMIATEPIEAWKAYFRWQLIRSCAPKLHKAVCDENFNFYGTVLSGAQKQNPRWKRVLSTTDGALGEAVGQLYVARNFSEESKKRVNIMVDNLMAAYTERIKSRDWMSEATKTAALTKLGTILRKLGYPDKWRDYSGLMINRKSYVLNFLHSNTFDVEYNISKLKEPVDRMEWGMTPATINAYYNPSNNEIVFPAGIMQTPFFDARADDAVNYGGMGAIIGHELTHGFDDQGSMFDSEGNMKNWWTPEDTKNFQARTKKLVDQFSAFVVIDSMNLHVNGELTLGENIADLGGLTIAYFAYKHSLIGKPAPAKIDGFTGDQRFFISWAQSWRNSMRQKSLINQVKTNPHSPAKFRVLGPLSNIQEFYDAFDIKPTDKMYRKPEDRVLIW
ncbi:MAG: M13 family metallopeptidase [Bacteroidetes bacterium]|nr:M13 family metallopeptidase [Bacteroidota bacterium]